jgi:hypothetical protein
MSGVATRVRFAARASLAVAVSLAALAAAVGPAWGAGDEAAPGESNISVKVLGPSAAPSASPGSGSGNGGSNGTGGGGSSGAGAGSSSGGGRGSATGTGSSNGDSVVPQPEGSEPGIDEIAIAGGLYLSDISGSSSPTFNPFDGRTDLWMTVRNLSDETVEATADFSLATLWGTRIDGSVVKVSGLKPGEVRVVSATLHGSGQWPAIVGRATFTPPDTVAGQQTAPVSRAAVVYVFPWLVLVLAVIVGVALIVLRVTTRFVREDVAPAVTA